MSQRGLDLEPLQSVGGGGLRMRPTGRPQPSRSYWAFKVQWPDAVLHLSCLTGLPSVSRRPSGHTMLPFGLCLGYGDGALFPQVPAGGRASTGQDRCEVRPLPPCRAVPPTHSARGVGAFVCCWLRAFMPLSCRVCVIRSRDSDGGHMIRLASTVF